MLFPYYHIDPVYDRLVCLHLMFVLNMRLYLLGIHDDLRQV